MVEVPVALGQPTSPVYVSSVIENSSKDNIPLTT